MNFDGAEDLQIEDYSPNLPQTFSAKIFTPLRILPVINN